MQFCVDEDWGGQAAAGGGIDRMVVKQTKIYYTFKCYDALHL